jgi:type I restriction enzyme S subunit
MQLLKYFKELTVQPKNAQELKGLILQLAIQGKLTANWRKENPDVEPAEVLINKILKDKKRMSKQKKKLSIVMEEEKPFKLPESWVWCRLGEVTDLPYGKGLSKKNLIAEGYYVFGANGIIGRYSSYLYEDEQLLISCRGAYSGKTNISPKKCFITSNSLVCEFFNKELTYYKYFFYSITALPKGKIVSGSAQPQVTATNALPLPIALPPLEEQKEIVKVIEILFKEVEQLEQLTVARIALKEDFVTSALNQLTANNARDNWNYLQDHFKNFFNETTNIKKLRETVLQLAVQGKLTADWRTCHPKLTEGSHHASELLKRIQEEKARLIKDKKIKKEKPLPTITKEEIPYDLPEGWIWCRLGETLLYSDSGKSPDCIKKPVIMKEWGVLTTTAIQQNKFVESANKVLPLNYEINTKQIVEVGDILITRAGPINRTGIACKVEKLRFNLILSDKTIRLKYITNSLFPDFIVLTLNSESIRKLLLGKMIGMASSQVNISQANIKGICFPFPPLEEQKVIVEKVNALMELCDGLEQEVQHSQEQSELLMKSCLREVFEGEKQVMYV